MAETPSDDQLLAAALSGDRPSLLRLLEVMGPRVRARIESKLTGAVRVSMDADDVMQVTYLEAVLRLSSFKTGGASGFLAWLSRLAENNLIDAVRALDAAKRAGPGQRVQAQSREESMSAFVEVLAVNSSTPSRVAARGEGVRHLEAALGTLPPDYEKVVRLYDLEAKPISEVAATLGRSEGATWMLRARAHDRLREAMGSPDRFFSTPA